MPETQKLFPTTRTERRLQAVGIGPWVLTPAAVELFERRRRASRLVMCGFGPAVLAVYLIAWLPGLSFPEHPSRAAVKQYSLHTGTATAFFGVAMLLGAELIRHLDRRLAATLQTRVARPETAPLLAILGRVRIGYLVVVLLGQVTMGVAFFAVGGGGIGAYRWGFLAALLACATSAFLGLWRVVHRPSLASDGVSLVIDERLRSEEAFSAISPIMFLAIVSNGAVTTLALPHVFFYLGFLTTGSAYAMWLWAFRVKPWPKPGPAPWLVQAVRPVA